MIGPMSRSAANSGSSPGFNRPRCDRTLQNRLKQFAAGLQQPRLQRFPKPRIADGMAHDSRQFLRLHLPRQIPQHVCQILPRVA